MSREQASKPRFWEKKKVGKTGKMCMIIVVVKNFKMEQFQPRLCLVWICSNYPKKKGTQLNLHQIPHFFNCGEPQMTIFQRRLNLFNRKKKNWGGNSCIII